MLQYEIVHVSFCFLFFVFAFFAEEAEITNAQVIGRDWYFTSWVKYTDRFMPSLIVIKICRDFKKGMRSNFDK